MNTTLPPRPCASICLPAARAISHDCVTLTSITSMKASGAWSTIFDTLLMPEAVTRMSTPPKRLTAAATILSQALRRARPGRDGLGLGAERLAFGSDLLELAALPAASTTLAPAPGALSRPARRTRRRRR